MSADLDQRCAEALRADPRAAVYLATENGAPVLRVERRPLAPRSEVTAIYARARKARRRAEGVCIYDGCGQPATDGGCESCRANRRLAAKTKREERTTQGLCDRCGDPATRGRRCDRHYAVAPRLAAPSRPVHCSECGDVGHNVATCPDVRRCA